MKPFGFSVTSGSTIMWYGLDPFYWTMLAPALLLGFWAQARVRSAFERARQVPANMTGAAAARYILDSAGLQHIAMSQPKDS